jgi:hypothetical protein
VETIYIHRATKLVRWQGDQIGRFFAQWVINFSGQFYKNYRSGPKVWVTFLQSVDYVVILTKNGLGYILGVFSQAHLVTLFAGHFSSSPDGCELAGCMHEANKSGKYVFKNI